MSPRTPYPLVLTVRSDEGGAHSGDRPNPAILTDREYRLANVLIDPNRGEVFPERVQPVKATLFPRVPLPFDVVAPRHVSMTD